MSSTYRYPGPQPFKANQQEIFFGRTQEIKELQRQVQLHQTVVLFGKSGLGKSSLLNAGLIPLIEQQQTKAISIRFGAHSSKTINKLPLDAALERTEAQSSLLNQLAPEAPDNLWQNLKSRQINQEAQEFLLLFDQFEELFSYPDDAIEAFAKQLSDLLYTSIPDYYRTAIEKARTQKAAYLSEAALQQLHHPMAIRLLFAIRSDRMSLLNQLKNYLPGILDNCYELKALSPQQAEDAILSPAYEKGNYKTPQFDYEDAAIEYLIDYLSEQQSQNIESFQLQILCEHLEQQIIEKQGQSLIRQKDINDPEAILENYYLSKINELETETEQLAARKFIEEGLIFEEEERRLSLYEGQLMKNYEITPELLRKLLDTHLLRSEPSMRGGYTYELSHDTLVAPVLKAKAKRKEEEHKIAAQEAERIRAEELAALRKEAERERQRATKEAQLRAKAEQAEIEAKKYAKKAQVRNRLALMGLAIAALLLIIVGYLYGINISDKNKLKDQEKELIHNAKVAEGAKQKAEESEARFRKEIVNRYLSEAATYIAAGQYTLAIGTLEKAKEIDPDNSDIQQQIDQLKQEQNRE